MGQQQLLLVILVTIIVGIATVVALNVFGTAADEANRDAVRQDLLAAAAQAQGIYARPVSLGGLGGEFPPADEMDLRDLNIPRGSASTDTWDDDEIENENGRYVIESSGGQTLILRGFPASGDDSAVWIQLTLTRESDGRWDFDWTENFPS